jgi:hypothetical protein
MKQVATRAVGTLHNHHWKNIKSHRLFTWYVCQKDRLGRTELRTKVTKRTELSHMYISLVTFNIELFWNKHSFREQMRKTENTDVRFEVFTAVTMKNAVLWDVAPCRYCVNRRFGGTLVYTMSIWRHIPEDDILQKILMLFVAARSRKNSWSIYEIFIDIHAAFGRGNF